VLTHTESSLSSVSADSTPQTTTCGTKRAPCTQFAATCSQATNTRTIASIHITFMIIMTIPNIESIASDRMPSAFRWNL
jgi:hypothetical protein